ncbi:hypothetical protein [Streptosporangium sp. NPDC087985]|uniref:hypothetical protein n=1 Tax=Streptosporangium sp. NPDC087985 TaxID=3366196 RepID=UPI003805C63D
MTTVHYLPDPVLRPPAPAEQVDLAALERDLAAAVDGEVRFDAGEAVGGPRRDDRWRSSW